MSKTIAKITNLSCQYKGFTAIDSVSLTFNEGEVVTILGPNGAGKTTLISALLGRKALQSGSVSVFGYNPGLLAAKQQIGAMLQIASLPDLVSVKEHITLFRSYYSTPMDYSDIVAMANVGDFEHKRTAELSGGQKQRLLFALAICGNPKFLILDEPTVGMDIDSRRRLWDAIESMRSKGVSVLLTTHYLDEADKLSDRIVVLNKGKIVQQATPAEIKRQLAHQQIQFTSLLSTEAVSRLPGVVSLAQSGSRFNVASKNAVHTLNALFKITQDVSDLTVTNASLEEAFVHLTRDTEEAKQYA